MTMRKWAIAAALLAAAATGSLAQGQQPGQQMPMGQGMGMMGPGMMNNMPMGQGMGMMGPGMMGNMPMGMGMMNNNMPMMMGGDINSYADTRAAYVKSQLGITDAQTTTWNGYLSAFRKHLTAMQQHHQVMMTGMGAGSTSAQRAEALVTSMDACHEAMKDLKTAYVALYQALTPDQKQRADALFVGMSWMM